MEHITVKLIDVVKVGGAAIAPIMLWGLKLIYGELRALRQELKEHVTHHQCELHRRLLQVQIDTLRRREED